MVDIRTIDGSFQLSPLLMKKLLSPIFLAVLLSPLGLISCSTISQASANSMEMIRKTSNGAVAKVSAMTENSLAGILPARVKVVEVRENELKKLPTGQEQALAFEKSRKRSFWGFGGPIDFQEPSLPQVGTEMDGSLLPPKDLPE
jgi:hypothetical protein